MGGGNENENLFSFQDRGLSPRGRGKHRPGAGRAALIGSIPAWAGETHPAGGWGVELGVYPRVGGGNGIILLSLAPVEGLSPRGRGKRAFLDAHGAPVGSIPAWAGETLTFSAGLDSTVVYPRVGGGNPDFQCGPGFYCGLSPRGRGKLR